MMFHSFRMIQQQTFKMIETPGETPGDLRVKYVRMW